MQCVQCKGYELKPVQLEPGLVAAQCQACDGVLMPLLNYDFWQQQEETVANSVSCTLDCSSVAEDNKQAKQCPKCSRLMMKYRISADAENKLDYCAPCQEVWFDNQEWNLFKKLEVADLKIVLTEAWQKRIRQDEIEKSEQAFYEALVGPDDFEKIKTFKDWLSAHSEKQQIKHYLSQA